MSSDAFIPPSWIGKVLITVHELAEGLPFHTDDLYRMAKAGQIPGAVKIKGRRFFKTVLVVKWLAEA
jgi:hypothetical protein